MPAPPHPDLIRVARAADDLKRHVLRRLAGAGKPGFWATFARLGEPGAAGEGGWRALLGKVFRRDAA